MPSNKQVQSPKFIDFKKQSNCNGQSETFGNKNSMSLPRTNNKDAIVNDVRTTRQEISNEQIKKRGLTGNPTTRVKQAVID
jgi:hypothetical protein